MIGSLSTDRMNDDTEITDIVEGTTRFSLMRLILLPVGVFLISRLFFLVTFLVTTSLTFDTSNFSGETLRHPKFEINLEESINKFIKAASLGDAGWYDSIAKNGYDEGSFSSERQRNWAFFPLFPLLERALTPVTGNNILSGLLISNLCFLLSLTILYRLGEYLGLSSKSNEQALWLLAFFPTSYFFSLPITESLFLFLIVTSFFLVRRNRLFQSGLFFSLATATRPTGLLLLPAYLLLLFREKSFNSAWGYIALIIAPLGGLIFMAYLYQLTGNPLAFSDIQSSWDRTGITNLFSSLATPIVDWNFVWLNLLIAISLILGSLYFLMTKEYHSSAYILIPTLATLSTGSVISMGRYALVFFPFFFLLGRISCGKTSGRLLLLSFAFLYALMSVLYSLHVTAAMA